MSSKNLVIDAGVDLDDVQERIGVGEDEKLRSSSRRERYLQKFARIMSGVPLNLRLHPNRADTEFEDGKLTIRIPTWEFEQPVTDIPQKVYEMMAQETITLHEIGHILYSDFDSFSSIRYTIDDEWVSLFDQLFNAVEDGVIEAQLRNEFAISGEFLIYYANVSKNSTYGTELEPMKEDGGVIYTLHQACMTALLDMCVYDAGRLDKIYDPDDMDHRFADVDDGDLFRDFLPELKAFAADILTEPDARMRIRKTEAFFTYVYKDKIEEAEIGGQHQASNKDSEGMEGIPQDFIGDSGESAKSVGVSPESAQDLPDSDEVASALNGSDADDGENDSPEQETEQDGHEERESDGDNGGQDGDEDAGFDDSLPGSAAGSLQTQEDGEAGLSDGKEEKLTEEYSDEIQREAREEAGDILDEAEQYQQLLAGELSGTGASDANLRDLQIEVPFEEEGDRDRWRQMERKSKQIANAFERRLQSSKRSKVSRGKRRGKLDTKDLPKASRGDPRSFSQKDDPDEPEYACMIVGERSSSMAGEPVRTQENGIGILAKALQSIDVDVSILDMYKETPRLVLPFGMDFEERVDVTFTESVAGGTPLAQMIRLARERLDSVPAEKKFMIILTDDKPANKKQYMNELDKCSFPILGVSMRMNPTYGRSVDPSQYFHRYATVESENELYRRLRQLAEEVRVQ